MKNIVHLMTAQEIEEALGSKYFYRQRIYRMAEAGKITAFERKSAATTVFLGNLVLKAFLQELTDKIKLRFPEIDVTKLSIFYDPYDKRRVIVDGLFGKGIYADADKETEEDLLKKIASIVEWIQADSTSIADIQTSESDPPQVIEVKEVEVVDSDESSPAVLPEEISWVRVSDEVIEGVSIKSGILVSLPSVAQFVGMRSDELTDWVWQTTFSEHILSAHYRQIQTPPKSGVWEKGAKSGKTPYMPFELVPELLVSFKQGGRAVSYPQKAELLYNIAKSTLETVGLAVSGNRDRASQELASIGKKLGLTVADQIIGIFKQYEDRDFQISSTKEFNSHVKKNGQDYAIITGQLTLGITERSAAQWKAYGASRNLPKSLLTSGREVMRQLSPGDSVGMAFGEQHYIKQPRADEAIKTGRQGKEFYQRLKSVGLLDTKSTKKITE